MRASYEELPVTLSGPGFESREATWGGLVVARQSCEVRVETAELLKALPGGACTSHHWGVVLRGVGEFSWPDRTTTVRAGDAYYAAPGHTFSAEPGTELVEFTPSTEHAEVMRVLADALP